VSRDRSVTRSAQDDDFVGVLTKNIENKLALMGLRPACEDENGFGSATALPEPPPSPLSSRSRPVPACRGGICGAPFPVTTLYKTNHENLMTQARAIMVLGTSSHVGKSLLTTALCRIFAQRGYTVAPFKSQNMSLNSAATIEGLEIGRAQALQAEAAGIAPSVHMNPILIKPSSDCSSQIIVRGKIWGQISAADYHQRRVEELLPIVRESYQTLASNYQVIILEGAGSPAEINLKQHDNREHAHGRHGGCSMPLSRRHRPRGSLASLLGHRRTIGTEERERIRGFCINKFRG